MCDTYPSVSVVIPTFNRSPTIKRAVDSAFAQTGVEVEVIVVDDGSTDNTGAILQNLQSHHGKRLRVIRQENAGASAARNTGLDAARATYVQFLDSDDTLHPEKIYRQIQAYNDNPDTSIVLCHGWLETAEDDVRVGLDLGADPASYLEAMCGPTVHVVQTSAPLWRRGYLSKDRRWDTNISLGDDLEFHIRCIADASLITFIAQDLFTIHHHSDDRLSDFSCDDERLKSLLTTFERIHAVLVARGRWTTGCAQTTTETLRSIFAVYLTRLCDADVRYFEQVAIKICGADWRSPSLRSFHTVRRTFGLGAARSCLTTVNMSKAMRPRLTPTAWAARWRKLLKALTPDRPGHVNAARNAVKNLAKFHPEAQSALYFEFNDFHAEIIPGYAALLSHAGYQVTVLHRIGSDVQRAVSRLPDTLRPKLIGLTLKEMRAVARSDVPSRYDLVMLGSATLSERDGYFGGTLDFLGCVPNGRQGHLVVEHAVKTMVSRKDRLRTNNLCALREMKADKRTIPMFAPVEFGRSNPAAPSGHVRMATIGRLSNEMRDVDGLFDAVRNLLRMPGPTFEIQLIGGATLDVVPDDLHGVFRALGRLEFSDLYDAVEHAHFLLPLLNASVAPHRRYLYRNTTGTRQLSLGFQTPMVMDETFAKAYDFDDRTAVLHATNDLTAGLDRARNLSINKLVSMQNALKERKQEVFVQSLKTLDVCLKQQGGSA